jgi:hypothetical protein
MDGRERADAGLEDDFHMGRLVRMASWGIGAAAALFMAVLAAVSNHGSPRLAVLVASLTGSAPSGERHAVKAAETPAARPGTGAAASPQTTAEMLRLAEQVRQLTADRDRVQQRLNLVERNLEDVTGSIKRQQSARPAAVTAAVPSRKPPAPAEDAPMATAAALWALTARATRSEP